MSANYTSRSVNYSFRNVNYSFRSVNYSSRSVNYSSRSVNYSSRSVFDHTRVILQNVVSLTINIYDHNKFIVHAIESHGTNDPFLVDEAAKSWKRLMKR